MNKKLKYIIPKNDTMGGADSCSSSRPKGRPKEPWRFERLPHLALEALGGLLELVHFVLEVCGSLGQKHQDVGLDFPSEDFGGCLEEKNKTKIVIQQFITSIRQLQ